MATVETSNVHVACDSFSAFRWSKNDTRDTQRQAVGHNAAGKRLCGTSHPNWKPNGR
jgi:hypothetical protein